MPTSPASVLPLDSCETCGFAGSDWTDEQTASTFLTMGGMFRGVLDGVALDLADARPDASTWSILEYVDHVRKAMWLMRFVIDAALAEPGVDLSAAGTAATELGAHERFTDVESTIAGMEAEAAELFTALLGLAAESWEIRAVLPAGVVDLRGVSRHALHEATHHLSDTARIRTRLGDGVAPQHGTVARINVGDGGVPKAAVDQAEILRRGPAGDRQHDLLHHGRPFQAVCLYGTDVIDALNAEGHALFPGAVGENLTVSGIDWSLLRPGAVVRVGSEVELELSAYAVPCAKNAQWFADRNFRRIQHDRHPGWSRIYAWVRRPGTVHTGDPFVVEG